MIFQEFGAPGLLTHAGSICPMPAMQSGLTMMMVVAEQNRPVPFLWRSLEDRTMLAHSPDGLSGIPYVDAPAIAASSLMLGTFVGRVRLIRLAPTEFGTASNQIFAPPVSGMDSAALAEQARTNGNFPFGFRPTHDIGS